MWLIIVMIGKWNLQHSFILNYLPIIEQKYQDYIFVVIILCKLISLCFAKFGHMVSMEIQIELNMFLIS